MDLSYYQPSDGAVPPPPGGVGVGRPDIFTPQQRLADSQDEAATFPPLHRSAAGPQRDGGVRRGCGATYGHVYPQRRADVSVFRPGEQTDEPLLT